MYLFTGLTVLGSLAIFLYGMDLMGKALERCAGERMRKVLSKLTSSKQMGLLTGIGITALIQSSSSTTVMTVGFVNSGLMTLSQAINVIMGANVGTTVTAWVLSMTGIESSNLIVSMLKPENFTPLLAMFGLLLYMMSKRKTRKDVGLVLLGFSILMLGMQRMSGAVSGLAQNKSFTRLFLIFDHPMLGLLMGAILTAVIQSSSASVGILQAFASTGVITNGMMIPIILGQNIGTCVTTLLSSIGASRNAKRTSAVHLIFNVTGALLFLLLYFLVKMIWNPVLLKANASIVGVAVVHSAFNILCTILLYPLTATLEKIVCKIIPDQIEKQETIHLDERLLTTPPVALECCRNSVLDMARISFEAIRKGMHCILEYSPKEEAEIAEMEELTDQYEDALSTYLVKLNSQSLSETEVQESAMMIKMVGDLERIGDHALELAESAEEMALKTISFHGEPREELETLFAAVMQISELAAGAITTGNKEIALQVEPLEQVIDDIKEKLRTRQVIRIQKGISSMKEGFVWTDILTAMERTSDHCSNLAGTVLDGTANNMDMHKNLRKVKNSGEVFLRLFEKYEVKYRLPEKKENKKE